MRIFLETERLVPRQFTDDVPGRGTWAASSDDPELGYRLRKSGWGKGYATEGSRALIQKGFGEYALRRAEWQST
jgi:RimJ/RimL family protein N-acetyltransferase